MGAESDGFGIQDFEANTEFRHSALSYAVTAVWPFEVREGMEGERTPETDLTRCHQDLEEGDHDLKGLRGLMVIKDLWGLNSLLV